MEPACFSEIQVEFDLILDRVATRQGIDPVCSRSEWIQSASHAFASDANQLCLAGENAFAQLLENDTALGIVATSMDPVWGFACPVVAEDSLSALKDTLNVLSDRNAKFFALSGVASATSLYKYATTCLGARNLDSASRCIAVLDDGFEAWIEGRSTRFRRSLRAADSRGNRAGIRVSHLNASSLEPEKTATRGWASPDEFASHIIERIMAVEETSWKSEVDSGLVGTRLGAFTAEMVRLFARSGGLSAVFASNQHRDVGYVVGVRVGDRYRGLQHSFDQSYQHLSVGKILQYHNIERRAADGVTTYDLGMHMAYKESYSDRTETTETLLLQLDQPL